MPTTLTHPIVPGAGKPLHVNKMLAVYARHAMYGAMPRIVGIHNISREYPESALNGRGTCRIGTIMHVKQNYYSKREIMTTIYLQ